MDGFTFECWAEGIAWFSCARCGSKWVSEREREHHSCEKKDKP